METPLEIQWTDYLQNRAKLRGFDLPVLEEILRHSTERYYYVETGRRIGMVTTRRRYCESHMKWTNI